MPFCQPLHSELVCSRIILMENIREIIKNQKQFYQTGRTRSYEFRIQALDRLQKAIIRQEDAIKKALKKDLYKSSFESYMTEIGMICNEITYAKRNLKRWMKPKQLRAPLAQFPSRCFQIYEPYGVVLITAPWNFPFLLSLQPLVGAIASGNCCIIKPSEYAPASAKVLKKILSMVFPQKYICVILGGKRTSQELLNQPLDYIFFTGSISVGKIVMEKAAAHLTPVTLELGGKSPCIVERSADLNMAAKRIVFGKFLNAGQVCVAPDYLLADEVFIKELVMYLKYWIRSMYGEDPAANENYPAIISHRHFKRLMNMTQQGKVVYGGYGDERTRKIAPTILLDPCIEGPIMQEEIFGPLLPIITYRNLEEAKAFISKRPKPLALYLFSRDKKIQREIMDGLSYGGGCINDTIMHLSSSSMGFGGVGESGMGSYHGRDSFETFSHKKHILKKSFKVDLPVRYQPYNFAKEKALKFFMKF